MLLCLCVTRVILLLWVIGGVKFNLVAYHFLRNYYDMSIIFAESEFYAYSEGVRGSPSGPSREWVKMRGPSPTEV